MNKEPERTGNWTTAEFAPPLLRVVSRSPSEKLNHHQAGPRIVNSPDLNNPLHRGSGEETGDNEARPDELGSGDAQPTVDATAFGGTSSIRHATSDHFGMEREELDSDGFEVMLPTDAGWG